jgi:hypothetical protein
VTTAAAKIFFIEDSSLLDSDHDLRVRSDDADVVVFRVHIVAECQTQSNEFAPGTDPEQPLRRRPDLR